MGLAMPVLWYFLDLDLSTVAERTVLSTVVVGTTVHSVIIMLPHAGKVLSVIVGM
jgi:hypothetical protein